MTIGRVIIVSHSNKKKQKILEKSGIFLKKILSAKTLYLLSTEEEISYMINDLIVIDRLSEDTMNLIRNNEKNMLIVGNNILRSELNEFDLIEFEDYIYERYLGKKIVIVYGNCHTTVISEILQQCPEFNETYSLYPIKPIHTISDTSYFDQAIFKWCDVFIHQSVQKKNRYGEGFSSENIISHLNEKCQTIAIPNLYRLPVCFFPQYTKNTEFLHRDGRSVFFRDSILDMAAQKKLSYKATITYYWKGRHFETSHLDKLLQDFFCKIEKRENEWDIKCLDYIKKSYKTEKLFYDPNHPTNIFLFYVAKCLFEYLGIQTKKISLKDYDLTLLSSYEMPILPEVKDHFGMTFYDDQEMRSESYNKVQMGRMKDYKDYVRQYLACGWQNKDTGKIYAIKWHGIYYLMKIYNRFWRLFHHLCGGSEYRSKEGV